MTNNMNGNTEGIIEGIIIIIIAIFLTIFNIYSIIDKQFLFMILFIPYTIITYIGMILFISIVYNRHLDYKKARKGN